MSKLAGLVYDYGDLQVSFGETDQGIQLIFLTANGVSLQGLRWELVEDLAPFLADRLKERAYAAAHAAMSVSNVVPGPWAKPDRPAPPEPPEAA